MSKPSEPIATPSSYVGFDTYTSQLERKSLKRAVQFNVMVVGEAGLGKTTFVNTLFNYHIVDSKGIVAQPDSQKPTVQISTKNVVLEENRVKLSLNIIDTPGFGDQVNNDNCWTPIIKYIRDQYAIFMKRELSPDRDLRAADNRVHCILYFIAPTGHSLKPLDINVLKRLSEMANVIPVIAKSDSLTLEERAAFKRRIREELKFHEINLYPHDSTEDDSYDVTLNTKFRATIPFAVIGSESTVNVGGKIVRGRKTRFGVIDIENEGHCEFGILRDFLIRTHLLDLIETTDSVHYETFRGQRLGAIKEKEVPAN